MSANWYKRERDKFGFIALARQSVKKKKNNQQTTTTTTTKKNQQLKRVSQIPTTWSITIAFPESLRL